VTATSAPSPQAKTDAPTYGNWRRPASPGLAGLGLIGTAGLFVTIILMILGFLINVQVGIVFLAVGCLLLAPLLAKDRHHRNGWQRLATRVAWRWASSGGRNLYRSGPLSRVEFGTCALPGLAAASEIVEARDAHGRPFALISHPGPGHLAAVIAAEPEGTKLVDDDQINAWVAFFGAWLASLGRDPDIVGASITVEAAPDHGLKLQREVSSQLDRLAPKLAREVLGEITRTYPAGSATIKATVAITWSRSVRPGSTKRRSRDEMAVEIGRRLPALVSDLSRTGAGTGRLMTAGEIAAAVRIAYEPSVAPDIESLAPGDVAVSFKNAGPMAADERWDSYRHDGAASTSWFLSEPPRGTVYANSLERLLAPHADIARKRVTMLYRPYDSATAARIVDSDTANATFNAGGRRRPRARDLLTMEAAEQAAAEEARGAGLVRFGAVVTATVNRQDDLPLAVAAVEHMAAGARVLLRPAWGQQATAFLAGLPLGVVLPAYVRISESVRDAM
jgi:hypothetical protein